MPGMIVDPIRIKLGGCEFLTEVYVAPIEANKKIDFDEFVVMMEKLRPAKLTESEQQMAMDEFKKLDKDGNGLITLDEMVQALSFAYTKEELKKKITDVDKDADGKMNYKEFLAMLY
ncbi:uncharacterized protein [Diadema antillarum]|uniref:uncharacterized protein n=1 Tax=Diadema antillarum TaxID=105358 RepID=UPI003A8B64E5